jgi:two-component system chemotaxis response regulator CheY
MRILLVDDQKTTGMALSQILAGLGHEPRLVAGGAVAWDLIEREDWRLILTDWMMPDMDGLELCRRIRAREGGPYRYIVMLTVKTDRSDRLEGLEAGADDFLTKPVDKDELIIRLAIARRILAVQAELEEKNARLVELASTDPLTGLGNRRRLDAMMEDASLSVDRYRSYSVVSLDIDHFKSYNDLYGHGAGDEVLRVVAGLLRTGTRAGDSVVRTGGEEFVIVMPRTDSQEVSAVAERLRRSIEGYPWADRPITASFGVATACGSPEGAGMADLLELADRALYRSKRSGRNRVTQAWPRGMQEAGAASCGARDESSIGIRLAPADPCRSPRLAAS